MGSGSWTGDSVDANAKAVTQELKSGGGGGLGMLPVWHQANTGEPGIHVKGRAFERWGRGA